MKYKLCIFLFVLAAVISEAAKADIVNEFIQIQCNPDLNFLRIETLNINGQMPRDYFEKHPEELLNKYGMIAVENLFDINVEEGWQKEKHMSTECTLRKKDNSPVHYKIALSGYAINSNPGGMCGGHRSFSLWLWDGEDSLIDELTFSPSCRGDSSSIYDFTIIPHEEYLSFVGAYHGDSHDKGVLNRMFWLDGSKLSTDYTHENKIDRINNKTIHGDYKVSY